MKKLICLLLFFLPTIALIPELHAQGVIEKTKQKVKDKAGERVDQKTDKVIDDALDKIDHPASDKSNKGTGDAKETVSDDQSASSGTSLKAYSKYDFIPGDKIIFQDDLKNEKEGEFPSQFNSTGGQGQVIKFNNENVFQTIAEGTVFSPRIKGINYLPEQFTIEFDANMEANSGDELSVILEGISTPVSINSTAAEFGSFTGEVPKEISDAWYPSITEEHWRHIAIAVNKTLMKVYIDQFRVLNVPDLSGRPSKVSFSHICHNGSSYGCPHMFIKNIRIAAGGIDMYKKVTEEGKIVTHGILFDVDKATLKPESMGTINSIYELMKKDPALKFEIDGHTDNSGTASRNLSLSEERAVAVRKELVKLGIEASRLTTRGFGDTKPIGENATPEGRANNRRVEFLKM